jgi:hypothetical protein
VAFGFCLVRLPQSSSQAQGAQCRLMHFCDIARARIDFRFRGAKRTLRRHRRMIDSDPRRSLAGSKFRSAAIVRRAVMCYRYLEASGQYHPLHSERFRSGPRTCRLAQGRPEREADRPGGAGLVIGGAYPRGGSPMRDLKRQRIHNASWRRGYLPASDGARATARAQAAGRREEGRQIISSHENSRG